MLGFLVSGMVVASLALVFAGGLALGQILVLAFVGAAVGAVVELVTTKLDDNLTIPIAVGGAMTLVGSLLY
jgi:dolichol kinase